MRARCVRNKLFPAEFEYLPEYPNFLCSVLDADGPTVDRCRAWCASAGTAYFRFSPIMATEVELDEKDDKILVDLMWSAMLLVYNRHVAHVQI